MNDTKTIIKSGIRRLLGYLASKQLGQLRTTDSLTACHVANAIRDALGNRLDSNERIWIEKIEKLRCELNTNTADLFLTDYGAGKPNLNRLEEDMRDGITTATTVSKICKASKPYFWALLLFKLTREFKPNISVELGTCLGISAAYQAAAQAINGKGFLITMEGATMLASLSEKNLKNLDLNNTTVICGRFQDSLDKILHTHQPIDYVFIDGHHDEQATVSYFKSFSSNLSEAAIVIFDDISWSNGMRSAWSCMWLVWGMSR
ncbi:MAG: class I SAM-dependent methyltransferase [Cyanobacteria bacterium P01_A01_bin.137]